MRCALAASLLSLAPAVALATPDTPAVSVTARPGPSLVVLPPDVAVQLARTDAESTRQTIDGMKDALGAMAYVPRIDPVSLAVSSIATQWDIVLMRLADEWSAQTQLAITSLNEDIDKSIQSFPETGSDLPDSPVFYGPILFGVRLSDDTSPPDAGFFGP